jgi:cytochrome c biogenesis protein CcdA
VLFDFIAPIIIALAATIGFGILAKPVLRSKSPLRRGLLIMQIGTWLVAIGAADAYAGALATNEVVPLRVQSWMIVVAFGLLVFGFAGLLLGRRMTICAEDDRDERREDLREEAYAGVPDIEGTLGDVRAPAASMYHTEQPHLQLVETIWPVRRNAAM